MEKATYPMSPQSQNASGTNKMNFYVLCNKPVTISPLSQIKPLTASRQHNVIEARARLFYEWNIQTVPLLFYLFFVLFHVFSFCRTLWTLAIQLRMTKTDIAKIHYMKTIKNTNKFVSLRKYTFDVFFIVQLQNIST